MKTPVRSMILAAAIAAFAPSAAARADDAPAIHWETDLAAAAARAERLGKPVLLVQGFGRVDQTFC